jgi:hypothetical protein
MAAAAAQRRAPRGREGNCGGRMPPANPARPRPPGGGAGGGSGRGSWAAPAPPEPGREGAPNRGGGFYRAKERPQGCGGGRRGCAGGGAPHCHPPLPPPPPRPRGRGLDGLAAGIRPPQFPSRPRGARRGAAAAAIRPRASSVRKTALRNDSSFLLTLSAQMIHEDLERDVANGRRCGLSLCVWTGADHHLVGEDSQGAKGRRCGQSRRRSRGVRESSGLSRAAAASAPCA